VVRRRPGNTRGCGCGARARGYRRSGRPTRSAGSGSAPTPRRTRQRAPTTPRCSASRARTPSSTSPSSSLSHNVGDRGHSDLAAGSMSPRCIQRVAAAAAFDTGVIASVDDRCSSSAYASATTTASPSLSTPQVSTDHGHEHATPSSSAAASTGSSSTQGEELWTDLLDALASPKCMDLMAAGAAPFSSTWEEPEDDGEMVRLWSFC
jgi:hypothetical protein